jgi:cellulose synthase/poly-beta-1,6-N-acetylglucosamine synthase-like glycosyltransferase
MSASLFGSKEVPLNWSKWIRQTHRWVSIIFTAAVAANFIALGFGEPPFWVYMLPLPPLFVLMFSGLYMFVLPYVRRRGVERAA